MPKRPVGRVTLLNEERHARAVEAYRVGAGHCMAADCIGVSSRAIDRWLERGRLDEEDNIESVYSRFMRDVKAARYEYEQTLCKEIEIQGRDGAWQAMCWLLERRNAKAFGRNSEELKKVAELEDQVGQLKTLISDTIHGGIENGRSKEEPIGQP